LPWPYRELAGALLKCERAHVELVADSSPNRTRSAHPPRALLKEHVRKHRGEFLDLRKRLAGVTQNHDQRTCVGYKNRGPDGSDSDELLFSDAKLLAICGSRGALQQLKRQLKAEGALLDGDLRPSVRRTIWANGDREQVIAIRARAFSRQPLRSISNHRNATQ